MTDKIEQNADKVRPLDLAGVMRHAFFTGAGYGEFERISTADMARWVAYEPELPCLTRIEAALSELDRLRSENAQLLQLIRENWDGRCWRGVNYEMQDRVAAALSLQKEEAR